MIRSMYVCSSLSAEVNTHSASVPDLHEDLTGEPSIGQSLHDVLETHRAESFVCRFDSHFASEKDG